MEDKDKIKTQLAEELNTSRKRVAELEKSVSERKKAEEALRESEEKYRNLVERANDGVIISQDEIVTFVNAQIAEMFGYTVEEMINTHFLDYVFPDERQKIIDIYRRRSQGEDIPSIYEMAAFHKDGRRIDIEVNSGIITYLGKPATFSFIRNITERKRTENNLRISEEKYRSLVETTDDIVYLVDKNCSYVFMNKKYLARFNLPLEKIIGKSYFKFHSKKESDFFKKDVNIVIRTKESITHEHQSERDDSFYFRTYSPLKDEKGDVIAVNVIAKDISELKQVENKLKQSEQEIHKFAEYLQTVREKERALVASELHDEIGQALTGLKMDIFAIKNKMAKDKMEIPIEFQKMEKLLDDSIQKLRKIYSDMRPSLLEHFGVGEAMRQYASDFQEESGIQCTFYQDPEEIILDENCSIALYRIFQGALNNIKWHAQATKANIRLLEKGPNLKLTIKDNGKGITEEQIKHGKSFGLIGMRERARFLGGELEIEGRPNKGTTVKLKIPLEQN